MSASELKRPEFAESEILLVANTAAMLAADMVQNANSGHPGAPMGLSRLVSTLWLRHLDYDPDNPRWMFRDRLLFSNGHASALWYAFLHFVGWLSMEDLKSFRQLNSKTPGHPESHLTPGVEATTGPLGQGFANAVGMAVAAKKLAAEAGKLEFFRHKIFCIAGDGCMQEGISHEAASLAAHNKLDNLVVIYDQNSITIDGSTALSMSEDVGARFQAYGWDVVHIDGRDITQVDEALEAARYAKAPMFIVAKTIIGDGSPKKAGSSSAHGEPLGVDELKATKRALGVSEEMFHVPEKVRRLFQRLNTHCSQRAAELLQSSQSSRGQDAAFDELLGRLTSELPSSAHTSKLFDALLAAMPEPGKAVSTRKISEGMLKVLFDQCPEFCGGSADLTPSTLTAAKGVTDFNAENSTGRYLRYGIREHAMGAIVNGINLHGGWRAFGSTFLVFSEYMWTPIRLAALSGVPSLFIFTHDSIGLGQDGPTHQPGGHLQALRDLRGLWVFRPGNAEETAVAYYQAMSRVDGPSAIVLTRQNVDSWSPPAGVDRYDIMRGGYLAYGPSDANVHLVFAATGSEVPVAIQAAKILEHKKLRVRVVSMPCTAAFALQHRSYQEELLPMTAPTVTIEAGSTRGWPQLLGRGYRKVLSLGVDSFGHSAPAADLLEHFGLTPERVVERTLKEFGVVLPIQE